MQFGDLKRETGVFQGQWTIKRVVNLGFSRWASKLEFATHVCIVPTSAVSYEHTRFLINSSLKWVKSMKISDTIRFKTMMIKKMRVSTWQSILTTDDRPLDQVYSNVSTVNSYICDELCTYCKIAHSEITLGTLRKKEYGFLSTNRTANKTKNLICWLDFCS